MEMAGIRYGSRTAGGCGTAREPLPSNRATNRAEEEASLFERGTRLAERVECPAQGSGTAIWPGRSLRRWLYAFLGVLSVGVGFVGVFVPGLPTTIFLIVASYLFTRSCPWLEEKLVRAPIFRPYMRYLDGDRTMPLRARVGTIATIWVAVSASCAIMAWRGALTPTFAAIVGGLALVGSIVVSVVFRGHATVRRG